LKNQFGEKGRCKTETAKLQEEKSIYFKFESLKYMLEKVKIIS
jgi:hypothetical protein